MEGEFVWREGEWCGLEDVYQMSHIQLLVIPYNGQANYTLARAQGCCHRFDQMGQIEEVHLPVGLK